MKRAFYALLILPSLSWAGTITTNFSPLGTITFSSGVISGSKIVLTTHTIGSAPAGDNTHATTPAINTTGANFLVADVAYYKGNAAVSGLTDSKSNFWTLLNVYTSNSLIDIAIYYSTAPTVGTGHTFTFSGTTLFPSIAVSAWSGVTLTPFDVQNGTNTTTLGSTLQPNSVTPSVNNELVITGYCNNTAGNYSINSGFTITDSTQTLGSNYFGVGMAYSIQGTATAVNPTWTSSGGSDEQTANIATFNSQ